MKAKQRLIASLRVTKHQCRLMMALGLDSSLAARELSIEEIENRKARAMAAAVRKARWDSRLAGWLHRHGLKRASWMVADVSMWVQRKMRRPTP